MNIKHIGTCANCKRGNTVLQMVFEFGELERLLKQPPSLAYVCANCEKTSVSLKEGISQGLDVKLSSEDRKHLMVWRASLMVPIRESHMGAKEYSVMSQDELFQQIDNEKNLDPNHVITLKNFVRRGGVTTVNQLEQVAYEACHYIWDSHTYKEPSTPAGANNHDELIQFLTEQGVNIIYYHGINDLISIYVPRSDRMKLATQLTQQGGLREQLYKDFGYCLLSHDNVESYGECGRISDFDFSLARFRFVRERQI